MTATRPELVLASASPRRAELLQAAGLAFRVAAADVDEAGITGETPDAYVARVAMMKAAAGAAAAPGAVVIAADTAVVLDGIAHGKPADLDDAARMLRALSGRTHEVLTATVVTATGRFRERTDLVRVTFTELTDRDLAWYLGTGEPFDKAGAYGIQGAAGRFVRSVNGNVQALIGLSVLTVGSLVGELGFDLLDWT